MGLKEKAKSLNSGNGIEFMENRTKGEVEELIDQTLTIRDYAFITGDDGEYAVFIVDEVEDKFYFGGMVVTEDLKQFTPEEHEEIRKDGLPTLFSKRTNKKGKREYTAIEFYPEED